MSYNRPLNYKVTLSISIILKPNENLELDSSYFRMTVGTALNPRQTRNTFITVFEQKIKAGNIY